MHICNFSFQQVIIQIALKSQDAHLSLKKAGEHLMTNYKPISVLPCFYKLLERIMYNRLYTYLTENNLIYWKQFGFQAAHSTEHAILQLTNQVLNSFNEDKFIPRVFLDLSKTFDAIDQNIFLKKLEICSITGNNLKWFLSNLSNRKQLIRLNNQNTSPEIKINVKSRKVLY